MAETIYIGSFIFEIDLPFPEGMDEIDCRYNGVNILYSFGRDNFGPYDRLSAVAQEYAAVIYRNAEETSAHPEWDEETAAAAYAIVATYGSPVKLGREIEKIMINRMGSAKVFMHKGIKI